jgi:flagellar P-ring protein precursor FlgI
MRNRLARIGLAALLAAASALGARESRADRIGDLCDVVGVRDNQLIGYGVVTGLNGTGDDISAPFATQSLLAMMRRLGVQIDPVQFRLRNVAAVVVTATIPPFARSGARLDIAVSSMGNGRSLQGGVLLQTPLYGADMHVYAVAQGPLVIGGYEARGGTGSTVRTNVTTTGRVPGGALVEREIPTKYVRDGTLMLALRQPDFTTAHRVVTAIERDLGAGSAAAVDGGALRVKAPLAYRDRTVELLARLNALEVAPNNAARVVINERTGTIVAGGDVRIAPVAIAQGGITIVIKESLGVSQPNPFGTGTTTVVPQTEVTPTEEAKTPTMTYIDGAASLADVSHALSTLGVGPRELASILQAMKAAGALRAEVVVQ